MCQWGATSSNQHSPFAIRHSSFATTPYPMLGLIHIPKTAGTTLHKILVHQAGSGGVMLRHDSDGPPTGAWLADARRRDTLGGLVIVGHQSVGLHHEFPGLRYVTCLRHPVARLVSHYHHAKSDPAHYLHAAIRDQDLDLAGYASSGLSGELSNGMVRMLAGVADFDHAVVDDKVFEVAKRNLESHFDAVILNESFDAGVVMMAQSMGWPPPYYIRRKVGRMKAEPPDPETVRAIEAHNRYDIEIHQWASARFAAETRAGLQAAADAFQRRNRLWGKMVFLKREVVHRLTHSRS